MFSHQHHTASGVINVAPTAATTKFTVPYCEWPRELAALSNRFWPFVKLPGHSALIQVKFSSGGDNSNATQ
ncbi:hypothetical protein Y1Q_0009089 [Alligator mississippiensis]|uniref:Uncharacterized protein n=1 Tax=Alligator mississippiensis TaxID=8496 RepID=A0A151M2B8_ALLMI|nr:hypothetical protein Y1Q_0009089 [Alligator mississippiensis]